MFELTTPSVPVTNAGKRRREPVVLTNRHCEKRVEKRTKIYDRKCTGLYVSITTSGAATFYLQVTDRFTGRARCKWLGVYNPTTFNVDHARTEVYAVKTRIGMGENVFAKLRQEKATKVKQGLTVDELIELRIAWMSEKEKKGDGEMRPRIENWANVASHLRRLVSPAFGKKLAVEVSRSEVAKLSDDIIVGRYDGKASVANARHMRRAVSGLFSWASEAGRDHVPVDCRPAANLPKLPAEHPRERVLTADEIKVFWNGLDRDDLPYDRKTCLALKLALVTMLRSQELLGARRDELFDLDTPNARFEVPLKRVKRRRVIQQPLSPLAVDIIKEALENGNEYVFAGRFDNAPIARSAMASALRGTKRENGKAATPGLCDILGLKPFAPHDLRRTAATLAGDLGFSDGAIAACLDHCTIRDTDGSRIPSVTGKVYQHSRRLNQKRVVLDGVAAAICEIIGKQATK
jgi:integrase